MDFLDSFMLQLTLGALISGVMMFILSVVLAGMSFGDHDVDLGDSDVDFSIDVDPDVDFSVDVGVDVDIDVDAGDIDLGHADIGHADAGHESVNLLNDNTPAPLLLLLSTFLLMFGTIGYPLYESQSLTPFLRLIISLVAPFIFVKLVSLIWKKFLSTEFAYEIPRVKIDNQVKTLTQVDEKGGMVLADTSDIDRLDETLHFAGDIKMQARTMPGVIIDRNSKAYVIAIEDNNTLIIDLWPRPNK